MDVATALDLLEQETAGLDAVVAAADDGAWALPTPSPGWTVGHQIGHLHWTDSVALLAVTDPEAFDRAAQAMRPGAVDDLAAEQAKRPRAQLLADWRRDRDGLHRALSAADPAVKLPWFGPPMRPITMTTARIMETWAHGLDVCDGLGVRKEPTPALAAVARIGYRTRAFAYTINGREVPEADVHVRLDMPDGSVLEFGEPDSPQRITGTADAFCRVVTQRRNIADVALDITGEDAAAWMDIAQAFAGGPSAGPRPGERVQPHDQ